MSLPLDPMHCLREAWYCLGLRSLLYTRDTPINLGGNVITSKEHVHRAGNEQKPYFRISVAESIITSSNNKPHPEQAFRWHLIKHEKRKGTITVFVCSVREQSLEDWIGTGSASEKQGTEVLVPWFKAHALSLTSPLPGRDCTFPLRVWHQLWL